MTQPPAGPPGTPDRPDKLRQRIAVEAARNVAAGSDSRRALFRAARRMAQGWVPPDGLPSHGEIRSGVQQSLDPAASLAHLVGDRFDRIAAVVGMLATVPPRAGERAVGEALEHALQMFAVVHASRPFDEESLTAALVHDVGRAIDRRDHVAAGLAALDGLITPRTRWLIESLEAARAHEQQTIGRRARQRLEEHPDFEDVLLLVEAERRSRLEGVVPPSLEEAIAILRALEDEGGEPAAEGP